MKNKTKFTILILGLFMLTGCYELPNYMSEDNGNHVIQLSDTTFVKKINVDGTTCVVYCDKDGKFLSSGIITTNVQSGKVWNTNVTIPPAQGSLVNTTNTNSNQKVRFNIECNDLTDCQKKLDIIKQSVTPSVTPSVTQSIKG